MTQQVRGAYSPEKLPRPMGDAPAARSSAAGISNPLNHRASIILMLALALVLLRLYASGKLQRAIQALLSGTPSHGSNPTVDFGPMFATPQQVQGMIGAGQSPGTYPKPSLFGLSNAVKVLFGTQYSPSIARVDQAGLTAAGGGTFANDYDYGVPVGTQVKLPPGGPYVVSKVDNNPGYGILAAFKDPFGVFEYVHLSTFGYKQGDVIPGGTVVGTSGQPHDPAYGAGAHLAVITDTGSDVYLRGLH